MAASWFWNTPDREGVRRLRIAAARVFQRNSLAKRAGWLISCSRNSTMNPAANHCPLPKFALWSLALDSVRQIFRPFGPLFPRNPFFPALRSGHRLFQQPSPGKQFLSSIIFSALWLPTFLQACIGYVKKPDRAWFFHPLACWLTLWIYGTSKIGQKIFGVKELNRNSWKQ